MFSAAKDLVVSKTAQTYVGNMIARYGKLQDLKIDSRAKRITLVCLPHGETEPIAITIDRYLLLHDADRMFVEVAECSCPRPWVQSLLHDFVRGRRVELPKWAANAL
jgi:hypothetical protein